MYTASLHACLCVAPLHACLCVAPLHVCLCVASLHAEVRHVRKEVDDGLESVGSKLKGGRWRFFHSVMCSADVSAVYYFCWVG